LPNNNGGIFPDVAFGPPGSDGRKNLSVLKSIVMPGFSLRGVLGEPRSAAEKLLSTSIAPVESGKTWVLIDAYEANKGRQNSAYVFEYTVKKGDRYFQHAISSIMSKSNDLYTLTTAVPEREWNKYDRVMRSVVDSFDVN
jgi:hypothetical protein